MTSDNISNYIKSNKEVLFQELLKARAHNVNKEENFRTNYAILLDKLFVNLGITERISLESEYSVFRGRIDSLYGNFIIEYKHPTRVTKSTSPNNDCFIEQVKRHIHGLSLRQGIQESRIIGVVFDGHYIIYIKKHGMEWIVSNPQEMTADSHALFLMRLLSVNSEGKALTVDNLIIDFSTESKQASQLIRHFYNILSKNTEINKSSLLFEQWSILYREVCGYKFDTSDLQIRELKKIYGLGQDEIDFTYLIFSIQTYFALLIKLLSINILAYLKGSSFKEKSLLRVEDSELLRNDLLEIEDGGRFRKLGISNFLEGDFFSWYLYLWNDDSFSLLRDLIECLNRYDYSMVVLEQETAKDLLKNLYHEFLPTILRKNLGEFYTPDWLAEFLLEELNPKINPDTSFLDPTCGSGTFIVLLIKKYIQQFSENMNSQELLQTIVNNIRGYDLNPLAVICARANYIIALGELISEIPFPIEIPIFLCDSMLTILENYEIDTKSYIIPTKAETFVIPQSIVENRYINTVLNLVNDCIRRKQSVDKFNAVFQQSLPEIVATLSENEYQVLLDFYKQMIFLNDQDLDGIWANVIKNAFAPVFQKKVDYIVGNPPWIDWQNLPENYRDSIQKYWYDYRVFDHKGQKAQLGSAHDDISVLMTYVIMDNFLKDYGTLAFVINQNLLQASGGGDGFRKFIIKETTPVCVKSVNDFVNVEPFKSLGVSNKTATIILQRDVPTQYPVAYRKWYKCERKTIDSNATLSELLTNQIRYSDLTASPIDEYNSPWMITTKEDRTVFQKIIKQDKNVIYRARKGVDTSANGIFWVREKRKINKTLTYIDSTPENSKKVISHIVDYPVESELLFPLLRGKDVWKWGFKSEYSILLPYRTNGKYIGKEDLLASYPQVYDYFFEDRHNFLNILNSRATFKKFIKRQDENAPEYALYNIGSYTFAPFKVIWKALAKGVSAVTISNDNDGRMIIPDHNLLIIPLSDENEAFYLTGILNSKIVSEFANAYISWFISAHILERINIPKYNRDSTLHREIVSLSKAAHVVMNNKNALAKIEKDINKAAMDLLIGRDV